MLALFPGLPRFSRSSASVYYTERKPKNKKRGRPGNEANIMPWFTVQIPLLNSKCATVMRCEVATEIHVSLLKLLEFHTQGSRLAISGWFCTVWLIAAHLDTCSTIWLIAAHLDNCSTIWFIAVHLVKCTILLIAAPFGKLNCSTL